MAGEEPGAGIQVRPMRWWDLDAVVDLERELFGATAWSAELFWSELALPRTRSYLVAHDESGLIGYVGVQLGGSEADVQTIAVAPAARRSGLGARLLHAVIHQAGIAGATSMLLEVRADNAAAIRLYQRHGFEQIARRRRYYQPGDIDALVMRLRPIGVDRGLA